MNIYPLLRPLLFSLDAETAHSLTLKLLKLAQQTGLSNLSKPQPVDKPVQVMGLNFKNPLGLAAGLDKNGDYIDALGDLGFGFIEIGTVTQDRKPAIPNRACFVYRNIRRLSTEWALIISGSIICWIR